MAEQKSMSLSEAFKSASMWSLCIGIIMIILGIYICINPVISLVALALYIGAAFIVAGIGYAISSFSQESAWKLFVGIFNIFIGLFLVANLGITTASLPAVFAVWCLAIGTIHIIRAFRSYKTSLPWGNSLIIGILGVIFSFLIMAHPVIGAFTITTLIGLYIIMYGIFSVIEYWYLSKI